ncbi:MAG: hypothetical protein HQ507_13180, partial [Candidatus Marinimicrobia bacterium]|nr:hypothetical protein [Candidatus Neomarinimicrobiota bacterium]
EFKRSNLKKWRWRHISPNGDTIDRAHRSFSSKIDCEENARLNGWLPENITEQDQIDAESINQESQELKEDISPLEGDKPVVESDTEGRKGNIYRKKRDSRQRKMLVLIASFLGLILITTLLILFKSDPEVELSDINQLTIGRVHDSLLTSRIPWENEPVIKVSTLA